MLIPSPRHTRADLEHWRHCEALDREYLKRCGARLDRLTVEAVREIERFAAAGPCYVGTSWGKDSTVVTHLLELSAAAAPLVWFRYAVRNNPDCALVRDEYLTARARDRAIDYHESIVEPRAPGDHSSEAARFAAFAAAAALPDRHVTGLRAEESTTRALSAATHGVATERSCRPILRWTAADVFAYLARHDLPVHPAYACTFGGALDRGRVRVGPIGGERGAGRGRAEWERRYYPQIATGRPVGEDVVGQIVAVLAKLSAQS